MTATTTPQVQAYAAAVRAALADVPAAEAAGLLDGLEPHLEEVAAEGGASLVDALGPPDRYAAELRASAGLHPSAPAPAAPVSAGPPAPPLPPRRDLTADPGTPAPAEASPRTGLRAGVGSRRVVLRVGPPARQWWGAAVLAAVVVAVVGTVSQSEPLSLVEVGLRAVAIAAGWTVTAAVVGRGVPDRWRDPARVVLVAAAVAVALVVGANDVREHDDAAVVYSDFSSGTTTAPVQYVPSVVGLSLDEATAQLAAVGLSTQFNGFPDGGRAVIAEQLPPAGSTMPVDWMVTLLTSEEVPPTTPLAGDRPGVTSTTTPTPPPVTATTASGVTTSAPAIEATTTPTTTPDAPLG
jgi:hypothetical protein